MQSRWAATVVMSVGVVALAGCSSGSSSDGGSTTSTTAAGHGLVDTAWHLESFQGASGGLTPAAPDASADLAFEQSGALVGSSGCNRFRGTYAAAGSSLTIAPGPTTLIAGASAALAAQESALYELLPKVAEFAISGDQLTLRNGAGQTQVTYRLAG